MTRAWCAVQVAVVVAALASLGGCASVPHPAPPAVRPYGTGDLTLLARYTAKETCSCLYVMQMSESYCRAWTKANPAVASWSTDPAKKTVDASALGLWSARAHFIDDQLGCALDP